MIVVETDRSLLLHYTDKRGGHKTRPVSARPHLYISEQLINPVLLGPYDPVDDARGNRPVATP